MGRLTCRQRSTGLLSKADTPVKTALSRRDMCSRLLPNKRYEALSEEPEGEEINVRPTKPVLTSIIKPGRCKSVLHLSSPAVIENPRGKAVLPAAPTNRTSGHRVSPAGHPTVQVTPDTEAFKGVEMRVKKEEQDLAVTPESAASSSMESDTTFSSDDDDEEDCYSSTSAASSTLPSPEIFRKENCVEALTLPIKEELLDLHLNIKNSSLLDASHAVSIQMHQTPDLSNIIDSSALLPENNCEINQHRGTEPETKIHTFKSAKAFKWRTSPKLTARRPILCKKKVWFKSPMIVEKFETKHTPATKLTIFNASEPVQTSSPVEQMKPDADVSKEGEMNSKEVLQLKVRLKRPVENNPEKAKFFDFIDDSHRDEFFQRMRERCVKLRSAPLFPLTAANTENSLSCDI